MSLLMRNLADLGTVHAIANFNIGASSTAANANGVAQTGVTIDRLALGRRYLAGLVVPHFLISANAATSDTKAVTVALSMEDSPTSTTWTAYSTGENATLTYGSSLTGTTSTALNSMGKGVSFNLSNARRYIRVLATVTMNASSSGTNMNATGGVALVLGGAEEVPAPAVS